MAAGPGDGLEISQLSWSDPKAVPDVAQFKVVLVAAGGDELSKARAQLGKLGWRF